MPSIFTREATRCQGTVAKVAIKASGATCAWTLRSDGAWHPVFVPIAGRVRNIGITRGAFPGRKILPRTLLKRTLNPRRARGQIPILATGFARGVILDAVQAVIIGGCWSKFFTNIFVTGLTFTSRINSFAITVTTCPDTLHIISATRLVIRGTVTFSIMCAGVIHTFVSWFFRGRATGVGVKGCVTVTFELSAAGVGTDGSGIRALCLRIGISVIAALRKIGIVIRTETNGILPGSTSTGLTKAQGFATINIVVIKLLLLVIKTHLIR